MQVPLLVIVGWCYAWYYRDTVFYQVCPSGICFILPNTSAYAIKRCPTYCAWLGVMYTFRICLKCLFTCIGHFSIAGVSRNPDSSCQYCSCRFDLWRLAQRILNFSGWAVTLMHLTIFFLSSRVGTPWLQPTLHCPFWWSPPPTQLSYWVLSWVYKRVELYLRGKVVGCNTRSLLAKSLPSLSTNGMVSLFHAGPICADIKCAYVLPKTPFLKFSHRTVGWRETL